MSVRIRETFDWDWRFHKGECEGAEQPSFDDRGWRELNLPHDWSVESVFNESHATGGDGGYVEAGIGWYRKAFDIPAQWSGRKVTVQFDGVYMNGEAWVNGHRLGCSPFGYGGFEFDLTPYANFGGSNCIAVRVDNSRQPNSRWFTGSGIYRHTWLESCSPLHVARWGVYVTTPHIEPDHARLEIRTELQNDGGAEAAGLTLKSEVLAPDGSTAGFAEIEVLIPANGGQTHTDRIRVEAPFLWSVEQPQLYSLRTSLLSGGIVIDETVTPFGIRTAVFDKDEGFLLNGERVKINGVCLHHDGGAVGAAVPERVWERRLELLKEMGVNGIRMSHNPPAPELLDLCDRMGFLVMDEAFDEWKLTKFKNGQRDVHGYFEYFDQWSEHDLTMMLRRDRNHPSIVIWSIGNEIPEQRQKDGWQAARRLAEICRKEDPTRPVTVACDNIEAEPIPAYQSFLDELDVVGYNYVARWRERTETYYADDRHRFPDRIMLGSENPGIGGIRGDYSLERQQANRWQGPYPTRMIAAEQLWKFTRMHRYVAGDFMWTGIDYIGETRWPHKNASFGVIDTCGFPKDGYYFYQSQWTAKPMAHLFPHWNWRGKEGDVIPVLCYTNCAMAELFVNGKSFGIKAYEFPRQGMSKEWAHFAEKYIHVTTSDLHLVWDVPYEPGVMKLIGYTRDGQAAVETVVETTGEPAAIEIGADRERLAGDGRDVCHLTVRIVDAAGRTVPTADIPLSFEVEGAGALIGTDNGDPADHTCYKSGSRRTFHGLALALVQAGRAEGEIRVTVRAEGFEAAAVTIQAD
ncbi:glycoside hydrolase family 2 TIM barrel-domain containing protein [Paenibacillus harenae]|uniref:glycoside hydrolase family 2 TIM barrel-domain containing protein n=1 Tax=Paenibacillus harenae TaxID=306543 RepID=UPI000411EA42|nr:glycoside hydrolase family 2 TIM barrel-domain containing protein [Paenibacillus harenae]